jgi:hypothetical protein
LDENPDLLWQIDESPDPLWRIDAWDSLAGRAFLCRRPPDGESDPQLDHAAVFVAPPYFQPEPLASRAPGLAATRGTFQASLFAGDGEVGFATLEDAIAFIRRGYNSHGSEPGPGAPVTRREGPLDLGGPGLELDLPELPRAAGFRQLDEAIAALMVNFVAAADEVEANAPAKPVHWNLGSVEKNLQHSQDILFIAGQELVSEMIRRFPGKGTPDAFSAWASAARSLGMQLVRLGLWARVRDDIAERLAKCWPPGHLAKTFALALPDHWSGKDIHEIVDLLFLHPHWQRWDLERLAEADVYPELAVFPLPRSVAAKYEVGRALPTMLTLMSAWFGNPRAHKDAMPLDRALLLFGGACIVIGPLQRESPAYRPWWIDMNAKMRHAFAVRLGSDAWNWIAKQLPDRVFHRKLEDMLRLIPSGWSRVATAKGADSVKAERIKEPTREMIEELRHDLGEVISDVEKESEPEGHALA